MSAVKSIERSDLESQDVAAIVRAVGARARVAARELAQAPSSHKEAALRAMAAAIRSGKARILQANARDLDEAGSADKTPAFVDRLRLDPARVEGMSAGLEAVAILPDPVGQVIAEWDRPNGLHIERVRVPLGVIGIVYEARPNVTSDAGGL